VIKSSTKFSPAVRALCTWKLRRNDEEAYRLPFAKRI
jgi:hypothetical protein